MNSVVHSLKLFLRLHGINTIQHINIYHFFNYVQTRNHADKNTGHSEHLQHKGHAFLR